jgi:hypothetical protein
MIFLTSIIGHKSDVPAIVSPDDIILTGLGGEWSLAFAILAFAV